MVNCSKQHILKWYKKFSTVSNVQPPGRIELPTPGLQDQCSNHWAMEAQSTVKRVASLFFISIQHPKLKASNLPGKTICQSCAVVAEWLRRWTWNPMGSPRAGSNPAGCDKSFWHLQGVKIQSKNYLPPVRFELTTPGLRDQCSTTEL